MRQENSSGEPDSALAEEVDGRPSQGGSMKPNVIIAPSEAFREEVSRQKSEAPPAETDTAQQPPHQAFSDQRLSDVPADTTENLEVSSGSTDETVPPADIQLRADAETSPPSKEWYVAKTALIIVVIALFVGGGAVGMSAWQAYQNSPEKLFDAMLASSMDVHTYRQTRTNIVREASGKK